MPKIILPNLEENCPEDDPHYEDVFVPKIQSLAPRYLAYLEDDDIFISPSAIPENFLQYVSRLYGRTLGRDRIIEITAHSRPYSLIDSMCEDARLIDRLSRLARQGTWELDACLETPKLQELAGIVRMPASKSTPEAIATGVILRLNDKIFFRQLAQRLGIPVVPGYVAENLEAIGRLVRIVGRENQDRIMLKKPLYGGGLGNLPGTSAQLGARLPEWYPGGNILVEHYLDFRCVIGSLVKIDMQGIRYLGTNVQLIEDGKWVGFRYPFSLEGITDHIKEMCLAFARAVESMGARGDVNVDWAVETGPGGKDRLYALECNLRFNGFGSILDCGYKYFKSYGKHVLYRENFPKEGDFLLHPVVIDRPGREEGAILVMPPRDRHWAVAVFADSGPALEQLCDRLK